MLKFEEFDFLSADGRTKIYVKGILPEDDIKGCVQIAHGIAEHSERYTAFMSFLAENGYAVFANDHLGHGKSVASEEDRGFFAEEDGWNIAVKDMKTLHDILKERFPEVPAFLFGHSMGSFLSRTYIIDYPQDKKGAILCGTGQQSPIIVAIGKKLAEK